jgi:hypothetical protein
LPADTPVSVQENSAQLFLRYAGGTFQNWVNAVSMVSFTKLPKHFFQHIVLVAGLAAQVIHCVKGTDFAFMN